MNMASITQKYENLAVEFIRLARSCEVYNPQELKNHLTVLMYGAIHDDESIYNELTCMAESLSRAHSSDSRLKRMVWPRRHSE